MRTVMRRLVAAAGLAIAATWAVPASHAATKGHEKIYGEPRDEQALVYLVRERRFQGSGRTMFVYADEAFLGTLENNSYTFAYLDPGEHLLWQNWARYSTRVEVEAGRIYYFSLSTRFDEIDDEWGPKLVEEVEFYCSPEAKERAKAEQHIAKRYSKAKRNSGDEKEYVGTLAEREEHIAEWPRVDLGAYSILFIDEFRLTDPKAATRKKADQVKSAPERLAREVARALPDDLFDEIRRGAQDSAQEGVLVLRLEITQYKPGSRMARGMFAGTGSAHLDFTGHLVDAMSGEELAIFSGKRTWGWGGARGQSFGIEEMEDNVAYEISLYLQQSKGHEPAGETPGA